MHRALEALALGARAAGQARARHRVHGRGPLPHAAVPHPARDPRRSGRGRADRDRRSAGRGSRRRATGGGARRPRRPGGRARRPPGRRAGAQALWHRRENVFDTQVAAGFAGMGAQASYESLLAEMLGVRVAKSASFTRWDTRPLSAEQLAYAREDVVHLLELAAELERRLQELRAPAVGLRGVRAARALERRARARGDLRAPAPGRRAERLGAPDRARAGRRGASRRRRARTGRCRASSATWR